MEAIIFLIILVFAIPVINVISTSIKKGYLERKLNTLNDFSASQKVMGEDGNSGIAVDEGRERVCLIKTKRTGDIELDVLSYRDILSSEIFEDGEKVTKTARGSQLAGTLIGGLALDGVGAIVGGLSGQTTSSDKVNKIDLRIIVNRTENPIHDINFMNTGDEKNGFSYNTAMKKVRHWHGVMEVLIKRADMKDNAKHRELADETPKLIPNVSVADELAKLGELKKQGLLTDEEFLSQKAKLLT